MMSLSLLGKRLSNKAYSKIRLFLSKKHDECKATYGPSEFPVFTKLTTRIPAPDKIILGGDQSGLRHATSYYLVHHFNLMGSGWVQVKHGMVCKGFEGHQHSIENPVNADTAGQWLKRRINSLNLAESQRIWEMVDGDYEPIDWQLDFKSGYRWREDVWYGNIEYGNASGADVKVPRELARMQHLPHLALAYRLSGEGQKGFADSQIYVREFRNQILDFASTNPPRFGVNWESTMDVAIRAANWLVAYDLFRAVGAPFDKDFEQEFIRSIHEHGRHIANNLEWSPIFRNNHFMANICGLVFVAAYLPASDETDLWLAFAISQLNKEVMQQFGEDGSTFEGSTSYHRFSTEMVLYAASLIVSLDSGRTQRLAKYRTKRPEIGHKRGSLPLEFCYHERFGKELPLGTGFLERLRKMADFTRQITKPDGHVPQIGDNDNARFLRLHVPETGDRDGEIQEDMLDHRHLLSAAEGMFGEGAFGPQAIGPSIEREMIRSLCHQQSKNGGSAANVISEQTTFRSNHFGVCLLRDHLFYVLVRCGPGNRKWTGHFHNDQLSVNIAVKGKPLLMDAGTYVYTALPDRRNTFRSSAAHSAVYVDGMEQNPIGTGLKGCFTIKNSCSPKVTRFENNTFAGEHSGYGTKFVREIQLTGGTIKGQDICPVEKTKTLVFRLHPNASPKLCEDPRRIEIDLDGTVVVMSNNAASWEVADSEVSPSYGVVLKTHSVKANFKQESISWEISIGASA